MKASRVNTKVSIISAVVKWIYFSEQPRIFSRNTLHTNNKPVKRVSQMTSHSSTNEQTDSQTVQNYHVKKKNCTWS